MLIVFVIFEPFSLADVFSQREPLTKSLCFSMGRQIKGAQNDNQSAHPEIGSQSEMIDYCAPKT